MSQHTELTDIEVLRYLTEKDQMQTGIQYLYDKHFETLSRYVLYNNGSWEDAQDLFQETLIAFIALVQQQKFRGEASIKTFLYTMNKNIWLNELKKRGRSSLRAVKYEQLQDRVEEQINTVIEKREAGQLLLQKIEALGETCKKILVLFYYEKRSMKEILALLDYENEQVVRNKKYKCLKELAQALDASKDLSQKLKTLLYE